MADINRFNAFQAVICNLCLSDCVILTINFQHNMILTNLFIFFFRSDVLALPIFKQEESSLPSDNENKILPFEYVLCASTSPAVKLHEETLTYLNQGRAAPVLFLFFFLFYFFKVFLFMMFVNTKKKQVGIWKSAGKHQIS